MPIVPIDDAADPRLSDYTGVSQPSKLVDRGLFVAEGRFVVRRLLSMHPTRIRSLLLNSAALTALDDLLHAADRADVFVAPPRVVEALTGFHLHRGCLAIAERPAEVSARDLSLSGMVVVLERVTDTDNVGAVFRSAEAFGAEAVLLSPGCGDPLYRKAIRTSAGSSMTVPFARDVPWPTTLDHLKARGALIAALTPDDGADDIGVFTSGPLARGPVALVLGTEGHGLTIDALARADARLRIPMTGAIDSLNIATAASIALHRLYEVRHR